jgi:hypothetical protein
MSKNWLSQLTLLSFGLGSLFALSGIYLSLDRPKEILPKPPVGEKTTVPKNAFLMNENAYKTLGEPFFQLKTTPITLQVPDLKNQVIYLGKNNRPDAQRDKVMLHFSIPASQSQASIPPQENLYLTYDTRKGQWIFSQDNTPSTLWMKAFPAGDEVKVELSMINEEGIVTKKPLENSVFTLKEKDPSKMQKSFELGKWRVDATLLSRQKTRWYGRDLFLERHGGGDFSDAVGRERIDFLEFTPPYSIFAKEGDFLIWKGERWQKPKEGEETIKYPLLLIKKINDRVMNLELWDVEGRGKFSLNLLKSGDAKVTPNFLNAFKFMGAKTRSQFLFEVNQERLTLKPKDWLLFTKEGWKTLDTAEEIDDFVTRKITGPLLVIDSVERKGDAQILNGTLFNPSRTESQSIEIPLQPGRSAEAKKEDVKEKEISQKQETKRLDPPQAARGRDSDERQALILEREERRRQALEERRIIQEQESP